MSLRTPKQVQEDREEITHAMDTATIMVFSVLSIAMIGLITAFVCALAP